MWHYFEEPTASINEMRGLCVPYSGGSRADFGCATAKEMMIVAVLLW